jgi:hypothetical protein
VLKAVRHNHFLDFIVKDLLDKSAETLGGCLLLFETLLLFLGLGDFKAL